MKKTYTRDEFKKLLVEAVGKLLTDKHATEGGATMFMTLTLVGALLAGKIEELVFDENTDEIEIVENKEE